MNESSLSHLYGSGVFTTIRIIDGEPWLWDKHWRRLIHDAERLGIDTSPYSEYMVRRGLDESIPDADKAKALKARITITDRRSSPLWSDTRPEVPSNVEFLVAPLRRLPRPFRRGISPHRVNSTSPIVGLKTCNYLDQLMALRHSMDASLNEGVRTNENGHITSACMANVFWLRGDQLFTPSLATGCLPGTTREFVMENTAVTEVDVGTDELREADAIFLTSAGLGVVAVDEFRGRAIGNVEHAILELIPANG
jgi:branched-subunit amino acid aminotransferase/4-amino-4-deoxychorismate lyase